MDRKNGLLICWAFVVLRGLAYVALVALPAMANPVPRWSERPYAVTTGTSWPMSMRHQADVTSGGDKLMHVRDAFGRPFTCLLPAPGAEVERSHLGDEGFEAAWVLMDRLNGTCTELKVGWWTYELCHGVRIRQYHKVR
jgi:hypothetical protein